MQAAFTECDTKIADMVNAKTPAGTKIILSLIVSSFILLPSLCRADETALFFPGGSCSATGGKANVLILMDQSGSMNCCVEGCVDASGNDIWPCDPLAPPPHLNKTRKAKAAIHTILDANGDGFVNSQDEESLGITFGYMRYWDCPIPPDPAIYGAPQEETDGNYNSGCITVKKPIGSSFSDLSAYVHSSYADPRDAEFFAAGTTPLASSLMEAKKYLDDYLNSNPGQKSLHSRSHYYRR